MIVSLISSTSPYCFFLCEIFIFCKFKICQNLDLEWEIANKNQLFVPFEAVGLSISGHLNTQVYLRSVLSFYMGLVWVPIGSLFLEMMSNLLMSRVAVLTTCKTDYLRCFLFPCEIQLKPPTNSFKRVKNSYALKQIFKFEIVFILPYALQFVLNNSLYSFARFREKMKLEPAQRFSMWGIKVTWLVRFGKVLIKILLVCIFKICTI